ncbi:hypothetical protein HOF92_17010 [bacterium]|jgi:hypothetical protein|nr:hypothetical protein [bacterium]
MLYAFREPPKEWIRQKGLVSLSLREAFRILPEEVLRTQVNSWVTHGFPILLRDPVLVELMTKFVHKAENRRKNLEISRKIP